MAESPLKAWKCRYLASVKEVFHHIEDRGPRVGQMVCPDASYPRLRLLRAPRGQYATIPFSGTLLEEVEVSQSPGRYSPKQIQDLFVPDGEGFVPKTVVLLGPPGIGKTVICQKVMLDWAGGKLYAEHFNMVVYLRGGAINQITGEVTISDLVAQSSALHCPENLLRSAFTDSAKVLIIIDGLDELRWTLEDDYADHDDPFDKTHKETFLRCLLEKAMLGQASLLLTSRTMFLHQMKDFAKFPSCVELLGFSEEDLQPYFHNFFQAKDPVGQAVSVLKGNRVLMDLCSVPLTCWLVCNIVKARMGAELSKCKTLSAVYLVYLKSLVTNHGEREVALRCLKKLCALANHGMLSQKSLFDEADLGSHGLTPSEVAAIFPNGGVFQADVEASNNWRFIHLSLQEFLAAFYYVLGEEAEVKEAEGARGDTFLPRVCKGRSLFNQSADHPWVSSTVRFLFGLLNEGKVKEFATSFGFSASVRAKSAMDQWLRADGGHGFCMEALGCFYEAQDEELRREAFSAQDLVFPACLYASAMENVPIHEMVYCLANRESFGSISMEDYLMRPEDLAVLAPFFHGSDKLAFTRCGFAEDLATGDSAPWLANPDSKIRELEFHVCVVVPSFYQDLRSLISSSRSLTKLTFGHHILEDSALQALCDALQQPGCTLQELTFDDCNLASPGCGILGSALKANRSLHKLDLALNKMEDEGVRLLCEGLKDPACTLQELRVEFCEVSAACCDHLRSALLTNRNLTSLNVRDCKLEDAGVTALCQALQQPGCALRELGLEEVGVSASVCEDLRSVLLTNRMLTSLNLTYNDLTDCGVRLLCEGVCAPGCTLRRLGLSHCELTPASCPDLRSVLTQSPSLTSLDLTWNNVQDSGVTVLCEGLRDPNCALKELRLSGCGLSSASLEELSSVISTKSSLTKLDVSANHYAASGMAALCEALMKPACALQELRVGYCEMTASLAGQVMAAIDANRSLSELDVSFAYEDEEPPPNLDLMCGGFSHPSCTLRRSDTQDGLFIYFQYRKQE